MDKKLKSKWVGALRGRKYKQGDCYLHYAGKFCCLGVLADIQGCTWREESDGTKVPVIKDYVAGSRRDPNQFVSPRFAGGLPRSAQKTLATMNDQSTPFRKIADYIAKNL